MLFDPIRALAFKHMDQVLVLVFDFFFDRLEDGEGLCNLVQLV